MQFIKTESIINTTHVVCMGDIYETDNLWSSNVSYKS